MRDIDMNIEAQFMDGESFMVTIRDDAMDLHVSAFIDMQKAAKLKDDLTVALHEYDNAEVGKQMDAEKYMEGK